MHAMRSAARASSSRATAGTSSRSSSPSACCNFVVLPLTLVAHGSGPFGVWVATTVGSALTAPYAAHALTVVYYALVQPGRPVVLEAGRRWESVWTAEAGEPAKPARWDEYERQFDEREQRWS